MITGPIIAEIAALVGEPARATMMSSLLDGRALTAGELARAARITPQTDADAITDTHRDVDDDLFARLQRHYDDDTIAELTMIIAWENASSRFNRACRIPSQGFWQR
jgi:alkylhydroperoxidase family enzyme